VSSPHRDTFVQLVNRHNWVRGAELGVDKGILFERILRDCPRLQWLVGVDICPVPHRRAKCEQLAEQYGLRAKLLVMTTDEAARVIGDNGLDFVFIDADHTEDGAAADIAHWTPKVRAGGWVGGHDYNVKTFPGVVRAVDQAFGKRVITYQPGHIWGVWR
jgi:predicted O-methyltransferase YrrM